MNKTIVLFFALLSFTELFCFQKIKSDTLELHFSLLKYNNRWSYNIYKHDIQSSWTIKDLKKHLSEHLECSIDKIQIYEHISSKSEIDGDCLCIDKKKRGMMIWINP